MKKLNYELKNMCQRNRDGSFATQKDRHNTLQLLANQLMVLGFQTNTMSVHDLKGRHANRLVEHWREQGISTGTMKNRLAVLRWWAEKTGNLGAVKSNDAYGIGRRQFISSVSKAETLAGRDLSGISPHVAMSLRLQEAFGLRREEAMKFTVSYALQGCSADTATYIILKASWTKGGRPREIPIISLQQRILLKEVSILTGKGSLIPPGRTYREHVREFERESASIGVGHTHGLRHHYAQCRYEALTGQKPPVAGGKSRKAMTPVERLKDDDVRRQISAELGHNRMVVTAVYLGT